MTLTEVEFLKFLVQSSRIRAGLPDTVLGFNASGKPEATLKSSLGGGATELIGKTTLGSPSQTITVTPSSSIPSGSLNKILVIAQFQVDTDVPVSLALGGVSGTFTNKGVKSDGTTVSAITRSAGTIGSGEDNLTFIPCSIEFNLNLPPTQAGGISGDAVEASSDSVTYRAYSFTFDTEFTAITNFVLSTDFNSFLTGSQLIIYQIN